MEVLNKSHFSFQMRNCPIPIAEHSGHCLVLSMFKYIPPPLKGITKCKQLVSSKLGYNRYIALSNCRTFAILCCSGAEMGHATNHVQDPSYGVGHLYQCTNLHLDSNCKR